MCSMRKYRTKTLLINTANIAFVLIFCLLCSLIPSDISKAEKTSSVEGIYDNGEKAEVWRRQYGLVAKNVIDIKVGSDIDFWELYIRQKKEKEVKEVNFFRKVNEKNCVYDTNIVSKDAKAFYPHLDGSILVDNKGRVLFTGSTTCDYFVHHKSKKECKKAYRSGPYINKRVIGNVTRTWGDNEMFAYVKNNNLYITGEVISGIFNNDQCYGHDTVLACFKGRGKQVKQVVCGDYNIFVLLNDGSVWGIGENNANLISQSNQKKYTQFVKIIDSGVKQVAVSKENVAVIKNDYTLWVWGRLLHSPKKGCSATPQKIASNVTEVSLSDTRGWTIHSILVYVKKNHKAYGMGYNQGYAFTEKNKKGWHKKPVLLMKNVKHVYAAQSATLLLNCKGELYWSGTQKWYGGYGIINSSGL